MSFLSLLQTLISLPTKKSRLNKIVDFFQERNTTSNPYESSNKTKGSQARKPWWKSKGEGESDGDDKIWKERVSLPLHLKRRRERLGMQEMNMER